MRTTTVYANDDPNAICSICQDTIEQGASKKNKSLSTHFP